MAKIYRKRSLLEFQKAFATEEACALHLKEVRWPDGFVCPRCGYGEAWFIRTRKILDCKACRAQTSLTAGTIFHKTRTPLLKWYWIIYHMALKKVGVSVSEMQRALEIKDYKSLLKSTFRTEFQSSGLWFFAAFLGVRQAIMVLLALGGGGF